MARGASSRAAGPTLLTVAAVLLVAPTISEEAQGKAKFYRLPQHSFHQHLDYDSGLENWLSSGGTMALKDRVQLMPPVLERHGVFWNIKPVVTKEFDVRVNFTAKAAGPSSDGVFAVWIGPDSFAEVYKEQDIVMARKTWSDALAGAGFTFVGNKPDFKGLVLIFAVSGSEELVYAVVNDGIKKVSLEDVRAGRISSQAKAVQKWIGSEMQLVVKVQKDGAVVVSLASSDDSAERKMLFPTEKLPAGTLTTEGHFVGFSSWSGSNKHITLDIRSMETRNYDLTKAGEAEETFLDGGAKEWEKVLEEEKRFLTQASQKQAIERLTTLLSNHVDQCNKMGATLKEGVASMEDRLDKLGKDFGELVMETNAFDFKKGTFNTKFVMDHIKGISSILEEDKDKHDSKLSQVHTAGKELKAAVAGGIFGRHKVKKVQEVAEQGKAVEDHVAKGSSQTSMMLFLVVLSVAGLGCLFLNRMNYYEKKHYI